MYLYLYNFPFCYTDGCTYTTSPSAHGWMYSYNFPFCYTDGCTYTTSPSATRMDVLIQLPLLLHGWMYLYISFCYTDGCTYTTSPSTTRMDVLIQRLLLLLWNKKIGAYQTCHVTGSQHTDTGPTSPSTDPIMPGVCNDSHKHSNTSAVSLNGFTSGTSPFAARLRWLASSLGPSERWHQGRDS